MQILFHGTVAKHTECPEDNEDVYLSAPARGRVVLCDGASESFDASSWATLLVEQTLRDGLSLDSLQRCEEGYGLVHDPAALSWSKEAAYKRGSFATLVFAQDHPDRHVVEVAAIGDSLAVWSDGTAVIATTPLTRSEQFEEKPFLLSSHAGSNVPPCNEDPDPWTTTKWTYGEQGYRLLICMTDALGAWLLRHQERDDATAIERLLGIRDLGELVQLVDSERAAGTMRRDDTTLIIVSITGG